MAVSGPSYNMDLDFGYCFGRKKLRLGTEEMRRRNINGCLDLGKFFKNISAQKKNKEKIYLL